MTYQVLVSDAPPGEPVEIEIRGGTSTGAATLLKRAARQIEDNPSLVDRARAAWDEFIEELGFADRRPRPCYRCGGQHHTLACRLPARGTRVHQPGVAAPYRCRCGADAGLACIGGFMLALPAPRDPNEG